jgi:hypothetical protein
MALSPNHYYWTHFMNNFVPRYNKLVCEENVAIKLSEAHYPFSAYLSQHLLDQIMHSYAI